MHVHSECPFCICEREPDAGSLLTSDYLSIRAQAKSLYGSLWSRIVGRQSVDKSLALLETALAEQRRLGQKAREMKG